MSFDAGEIKAYLKLDRSQFNTELDAALAEVDVKTKDGIDVKVKPTLDAIAVEEVLIEEEPLRKDIEPEVKPTYAKAEAESVGRSIVTDIASAMELGPASGGGLSIASAILPTDEEMLFAVENWASHLNLGGATSAEILNAIDGPFLALGPGEGGGAWSSVLGSILPASGLAPALDANMSEGLASFRASDPLWNSFAQSIAQGLGGAGAGESALAAGLTASGYDAATIARTIESTMGTAAKDVASSGGLISIFKQMSTTGSSLWSAVSFGTGPMAILFNPLGAAAGTAFVGAFGAALGGAGAGTAIGLGGVLAAVIPGLLDLMHGYAAYGAITKGTSTKGMSPGAISLGEALKSLIGVGSKGLGAAEAQIMPEVTKFVDAIAKAIPLFNEFAKPAIKAMSGFFNVIDKGLGSGGFKSFVKDMSKLVGPIMTEFGKVIINLVKTFGGFLKLFGGVGAKEIGPWFVKITGEFAHFVDHVKLGHGFVAGMVTVFSNLGKILGPVWELLKKLGTALAPVGLQIFRIAGWMAVWIGRIVKIIPPWVVGLVAVLAAGAAALALALIGIGAAGLIVDGALTAIGLGILSLEPIMAALGISIDLVMGPAGLIVLAIIAVGIGIYELYKHWHTVWNFIKQVTLDVWHFIYRDVIKPIIHFFGPIISSQLTLFKKVWDFVWKGVKTVALDVWHFLYNDVIKPLVNFLGPGISLELDAFKKAWDFVWGAIEDTVKSVWSVLSPIFGAIGSGIGAITSAVNAIFGGSGATTAVGGGRGAGVLGVHVPTGVAGRRASGGPVAGHRPYLVGEQGPELFVPGMSGNIVANGQFSRQSVVINIDARGHASPEGVAAAVRGAVSATIPSLQAALARGAA